MTPMRSIIVVLTLFSMLSCASCDGGATPGSTTGQEKILVGSFNLQVFGVTKAGKPEVMSIIAQIIRRFDIVAVQEIHDAGGSAVIALKNAVNYTGVSYDYEIGPRLGRTSSKEQYAFFYNAVTIEALPEAYTFDEGGTDAFEREPYVGRFKAGGGNFDLTLVDIHTKPEDATAEISYLPTVISQTVICLGDFNAEGSYYDETVYSSVFPPSTYNWLIANTQDTTIAASSNTYDRAVTLHASDEDFTGNAGVFRFDQELQLGGLAPTDVSDHYPIWVEFWTQRHAIAGGRTIPRPALVGLLNDQHHAGGASRRTGRVINRGGEHPCWLLVRHLAQQIVGPVLGVGAFYRS